MKTRRSLFDCKWIDAAYLCMALAVSHILQLTSEGSRKLGRLDSILCLIKDHALKGCNLGTCRA